MRAGSTPDDAGWLANLRPSEVDGLGSRDGIAARYLHLYLTPGMLLRGETRQCLWVPAHAGSEVDRSPDLRRRADAVTGHRGPSSRVPPWRFAVDRQPDREFFAVPRTLPIGLFGIVVARFNPEVIAGDQVWVLDAHDAEVTAAIMISRPYRV